MLIKILNKIFLFSFWGLICISSIINAQTGILTGKIIDKTTKEPLPGANILVIGTTNGAATDIEGRFVITNIPVGSHKFKFSYIGYQSIIEEFEVLNGITVDILQELPLETVETEEVVVSVQAKGQREAINQQITSTTIKNIVSATKIQELPEANAAEAVGRLPGVSLQRQGGEGNKVIIRGLSPKYNKVQVEGASMAGTDQNDRSTDLSAISSFMLGGIEVSKTAMANQEADQLGGTVNFKLKEAPKEPTFMALAQGGYNGLADEVKDYRFVLTGSKRFFDGKFGVFANVDIERKNRTAQTANASYRFQISDSVAYPFAINLQDNQRVKYRYGGTVVLDYSLPTTKLKLISMLNQSKIDEDRLSQNADFSTTNHFYQGLRSKYELINMSNTLNFVQYLSNTKLFGAISYSFADNKMPTQLQMDANQGDGFVPGFNVSRAQPLNGRNGFLVDGENGYLHPSELLHMLQTEVGSAYSNILRKQKFKIHEHRISANLAAEFNNNLGNNVSVTTELGAMYKRQRRNYDFEGWVHNFSYSPDDEVRKLWASKLKGFVGMDGYDPQNAQFPYAPFIDQGYASDKFLDGQFELVNMQNLDRVEEYLGYINEAAVNSLGFAKSHRNSIPFDYEGNEEYYAAYIMPTFKFGQELVFTPGLRYEYNNTDYKGWGVTTSGLETDLFPLDTLHFERSNDYFLPMINVKWQINDKMDIRAAFSKTLSRPSYNNFVPYYQVNIGAPTVYNNPKLKPLESLNFDLGYSIYTNKVGLFSASLFYKNIKNFIYSTTKTIIDSSMLNPEYPEVIDVKQSISSFINNPNKAEVYGIELDWQSNFWFLPGAWSGVVLGVNYTYTYSNTKYPRFEAVKKRVGVRWVTVGNKDVSFEDRLVDQPDHIVNVMLGFDYKDFSIRGSAKYKSSVFIRENFYPELRQSTDAITFYDISIVQKLPLEGVRIFLNGTNLSDEKEINSNAGTGWFTQIDYYGRTLELGIRYDL